MQEKNKCCDHRITLKVKGVKLKGKTVNTYLYFLIYSFSLNIDSVRITAKKDSVNSLENNFEVKYK